VLKLMDFGIAKVVDQKQQMTLTGSILGSPAHMAPELLEGKELDFRSDVFSLGTILYWLATGQLPFSGKNPHQVIKKIVHGAVTDAQQINPALGDSLARIIRRALSQAPEDRFQTVASMQAALHASLAELDLEDVDAELKFFFDNPGSYTRGLRQKISAKLLHSGKQALREGKHALALRSLDRVLALEPANTEVVELVDGIHRRQRLRRRLVTFAASLTIVLLVAGGVWAAISRGWFEGGGEDPVGIPGTPDAGPADAGLAIADAPAVVDAGVPAAADPVRVAAADTRPRVADRGLHKPRPADRRRVAIRPPLKSIRHPVRIRTDPFFDQILIDDKVVGRNDASTKYGYHFEGELAVGKHRVVIKRSACQDDEFEIKVPLKLDRPLEFRRKLRFLPATLVVETDLADAGVYVDAEFKGNARDTLQRPITITMEGRKGRHQVFVRLLSKEAGEYRQKVWLEAGKRRSLRVPREKFTSAGGGAP
jgi:serine/threonine-protein kinase